MVKITFGPGGKFRFQRVLSRGRRVRRGCVSFSFVTGSPFLYCLWTDTYIFLPRSQLQLLGLVL